MPRQNESGGSAYTAAQVALAQLFGMPAKPPKKSKKGKGKAKPPPKPRQDFPSLSVSEQIPNAMLTPLRVPKGSTPTRDSYGGRPANDRADVINRLATVANTRPGYGEASAATRGSQASARDAASRALAATSRVGSAVPGTGAGGFLTGDYAPQIGGAGDYLSRAENAASMEYDPQIAELLAQQQGAKATQKASDAELKAMYAALVADMGKKQGEEKTRFGAETGANTAAYNQLAGSIGGTFKQSADQQVNQLQQLGIQAAAPDILKESGAQSSTLQGLAKLQGQSATNALNIVGQGAQDRMAEFGAISGAEGAGRRADLQQLLLSRLGEWGSQVADLRGAKGKLAMELADKYRNEGFDQQMAIANLQLNQDKFSAENERWAKEFGLDTEKFKLDAAKLAQQTGSSTDQKLDAWQNLGLIAQDIQTRQSPNDPARGDDYMAIIKRMFDQYETDDFGHGNIGSAAEAGKIARSLNSKAEAKKGGYKQVNSNFLNELAMEAYQRLLKGENYQYG